MTREIRPIYYVAPKAHDMAQRTSLDPLRYADPIERPERRHKVSGKAAMLAVLLVLGAVVVALTR